MNGDQRCMIASLVLSFFLLTGCISSSGFEVVNSDCYDLVTIPCLESCSAPCREMHVRCDNLSVCLSKVCREMLVRGCLVPKQFSTVTVTSNFQTHA